MEIIEVNLKNIDQEHICCAISDKKGETCVSSKKAWLTDRFSEGLTFKKLNVRGKVFVEYLPAEYAWCPLLAEGYLYINCFWVSGQFKGQGYGNKLLEECISDAKAKHKLGLTILSSHKKMPFLSDPDYLKHKGFQIADTAKPNFELLYLPFSADAPVPKFKACVKEGRTDEPGMVLYYSNQCPHTDKYVPIIQQLAAQHGTEIKVHKLETAEQAQNAPAPFTTYSFFYQGEFVTNEIFGEKKFIKFLEELGY